MQEFLSPGIWQCISGLDIYKKGLERIVIGFDNVTGINKDDGLHWNVFTDGGEISI